MDYIYSVVILISLFVILATSFNFVIGYGGLISIAHPIFYGLGAYTSALLARDAGLPVPLAMLAGAAVATVMSVVVSLPALRISGTTCLATSSLSPARAGAASAGWMGSATKRVGVAIGALAAALALSAPAKATVAYWNIDGLGVSGHGTFTGSSSSDLSRASFRQHGRVRF